MVQEGEMSCSLCADPEVPDESEYDYNEQAAMVSSSGPPAGVFAAQGAIVEPCCRASLACQDVTLTLIAYRPCTAS